jgi:hypothetical protein
VEAASLLGRHVGALGLLGSGGARVLLVLGLRVHLALLVLGLGIGVLVVDRWLGLASHVWRLGVLVHGNWEESVSDGSDVRATVGVPREAPRSSAQQVERTGERARNACEMLPVLGASGTHHLVSPS